MNKTPERRWLTCCATVCATLVLSVAGCDKSDAVGDDAARGEKRSVVEPRASVPLRVVVAEGKPLAEAIRRLRGEWVEAGGGELMVDDASVACVVQGQCENPSERPPDLLVFPSRYLGEACEAGRLRPMRASVLKSETLDLQDIATLVREREIVYGNRTMALPLGAATPLLVVDGEVPDRWSSLADCHFSQAGAYPRATTFLAIAACYAQHPSRQAVLFNTADLTPRLTEPPFVEALKRMQASHTNDQAASESAILLPTREDAGGRWSRASDLAVSRLPGAERTFDPVAGDWQGVEGAPRRVTLLGARGALVGVSTKSRNAAAAFRFAAWLAGPSNARQLATASPNVANVRRQFRRQADDWLSPSDPARGKQFASAHDEALNHRHGMLTPRILSIDAYLVALDEQVAEALSGEASAEEALAAAAERWQSLTDEVGRDRQRRAYLRHLGVERYEPESQ